ncbi:hypothetical protein PHLGIDRAFT_129677 [Phlebiopsis gigantea 11061_1 CR5-6]|uniref:Uncharacterized protein n=1 Tax=Phlebiopsis gigantea (strain 11061_1 CR5-6) TaxID=745531 RepID=A0A0C3NHA1_PHLG1|nr:hypothetical protein PHLGIDRAFT_129677 [Phlebiopsis gigantea 11061_1 CR5-6]
MFSSSSNPRSKSGTRATGSSSPPMSRAATANLTANTTRPGAYPQPNGYIYPIARIPTSVVTSTPTTARLRATPRPALEQRDSILRASILDTALELGVGTSTAVDRWMFGAIGEVDEEVDETVVSPSLTYASTATSDESWLHSSTSSSSQQSAAQGPKVATAVGARTVQFAFPRQPPIDERSGSFDSSIARTSFDIDPTALQHRSNKLRKARPQDGYTSDDGHVSEGGTSSKTKSKKSSKKEKKEKGEESEGGYLSDVLSRRKRNKDKRNKAKPDSLNLDTEADGDGEETDGGYLSSGVTAFVRSRKSSTSKSKKGKKDKSNGVNASLSPQSAAEDSDGGYLSSSSVSKKRRFFRLKKSDSEDQPRSSKESIPPVPAIPLSALATPGESPSRSLTPLPIAERFASHSNTPLPRSEPATTSSNLSLHLPSDSQSTSRSTTPISTFTARASGSSENERPVNIGNLVPPALPSPNTSLTSLESPRLTRAFGDAESVRSPSIDVLRAFGRQAGLHMRDVDMKAYLAGGGGRSLTRLREDEKSSLASTSYGSLRTAAEDSEPVSNELEAPNASDQETPDPKPTLNLPSSSAKMKRTFSKKQTPAPLTGLSARSSDFGVRSYEALQDNMDTPPMVVDEVYSSDADMEWDDKDLLVDVIPATPSSGRSRVSSSVAPLSPTLGRSPSPTLPSSPARSNILAKYDLPPPSPPPLGPLPQVPPSPMPSSSLAPSPSLAQSSTKGVLIVDPKAAIGKRPGPTPTSPLGKSSFTPEDVKLPSPAPTLSPTRPGFLSRKVGKRPDTAPESSGTIPEGTGATPAHVPSSGLQIPPPTPQSASSSFSKVFGFGRKSPSRPGTAPTTAPSVAPPTAFNGLNASSSSSLFLKRVSSNSSMRSMGGTIQRGRESPFPSRPVLPPGQRSRAVSPVQPVIDRPSIDERQPASAGAILQRTISRNNEQNYSPVQTLDVHWQPRSASALDNRAPAAQSASPSFAPMSSGRADEFDDRSSWVDFDDSPPSSPVAQETAFVRDSKFSAGNEKGRQSYESQESRPDIDSVLETLDDPDEPLQYGRESQYTRADNQSIYPDDDDYDDPRERETAYYTSVSAFASDAEDIQPEPVPSRPRNLAVNTAPRPAGRHSASPSPSPTDFDDDMDEAEYRKSRASIMDPKRSERVRQKLMQRVEKMRREGEHGTRR